MNPARIIQVPHPLLIATTNAGKVREIRSLLGERWPLLTLADVPPIPEPVENGATFDDNATLKARYYANATGLATMAEDSGLVIDALAGAPGVHSARYPGATYPDKFANLYAALSDQPRPWTARYVCALVVVIAAGDVVFATNTTCEGEIWPEPRGSHGFGYDPIFYFPEYGKTFGEISDEQKLAVAHRGHAVRQLHAWLESTQAEQPR